MAFNIYDLVLRPIFERLEADTRFSGIKIFYDGDDDEIVEHSLMPAINYYLLPMGWEDLARGSSAGTFQHRTFKIRIGFGVWVFDNDAGRRDHAAFQIIEDLKDWLNENRDFDKPNGVFVSGSILMETAKSQESGGMARGLLLGTEFELFSATGV